MSLREFGEQMADVHMQAVQYMAIRRGNEYAAALAYAMAAAGMRWMAMKSPMHFASAMSKLAEFTPDTGNEDGA